MSECIFTGEIAGKAAAQVKDDVSQESAMDGVSVIDFHEEEPVFEPEGDNEFIGVGDGIGGDLIVKVTMDGEVMGAIDILYNNETPNIGSKAIATLVPRMLEEQQTVVDTCTGATLTSHALISAVNDALQTGIVVDNKTDLEKLKADQAASVD